MQPMEWYPMARGLVEMMWPCMRVGQSVSSSATRPTADHPSDYRQSSQGPHPLTHHTQDPAYDVIADH